MLSFESNKELRYLNREVMVCLINYQHGSIQFVHLLVYNKSNKTWTPLINIILYWITTPSLVRLRLCTLIKLFCRWHFEIFFLFFPENRIWLSYKLSPMETICMKVKSCFLIVSNRDWICMKYQIQFSENNKKYITNLLSAEFAQTVVKINLSFG